MKKLEIYQSDASLTPRKLFSEEIQNIWMELVQSEVIRGALVAQPKSTSQLRDINHLIQSNRREQESLMVEVVHLAVAENDGIEENQLYSNLVSH